MPPPPPPSPHLHAAATRRTIVALNAASTLAQLGQYGIGFVVLPVWLAARGLAPFALGVLGALQWFGMLAGIRLAPRLVARVGARRGVVVGMLLGMAGFALLALDVRGNWVPAGALIGLGLGLRWLALEPWLYALVAPHRRGRVVGVHETLIALAPIAGPAAAAALGMGRGALLGLGLGASAAALAPLLLAAAAPPPGHDAPPHAGDVRALRLALLIVLGGGFVEGAFTVLVPLLGGAWRLAPAGMAALLALYGVGALLLQYPLGWFADRHGARHAALLAALASLICCLALGAGSAGLRSWMFVLGGTLNGFLTLGLIAALSAPGVAPARAVGLVSVGFTAAAGLGPVVLGGVVQHRGASALPWALAIVLAVLGALLWRTRDAAPRRTREPAAGS